MSFSFADSLIWAHKYSAVELWSIHLTESELSAKDTYDTNQHIMLLFFGLQREIQYYLGPL